MVVHDQVRLLAFGVFKVVPLIGKINIFVVNLLGSSFRGGPAAEGSTQPILLENVDVRTDGGRMLRLYGLNSIQDVNLKVFYACYFACWSSESRSFGATKFLVSRG
jgi:hypothetical protein